MSECDGYSGKHKWIGDICCECGVAWSVYAEDRIKELEASLKDMFALDRRIRELEGLLLETRSFHLRYEQHRDWLDRRNAALGLPPES